MGFFVNTLALRSDLSGEPKFLELLERVREVALGAYAHQDLPFEKLVDELQLERDLSRNPLVQVVFSVLNLPDSLSDPDPEGLHMRLVLIALHTSRFELECNALDTADGLGVRLVYNTDLFDASTIERMLLQYERVLESVVAEPEIRVSEIDLLGAAERARLLTEWNATAVEYARTGSLVSEFARQVSASPEALAVEYEGEGLTYAQLDARSNRLARWLRGRGVERGTLVGVCLERSLSLVVGILGVLKAGGGYVPLDAEYPRERLDYMVRDTGAELVLCAGGTVAVVSGLGVEAVDLDAQWSVLERERSEALDVGLGGDDVAYVMYTSGSTGWPKGVVVEHRAVLRLVRGANYVSLGAGEVMLQLAPVSFDASTLELWGSLLNGGELVLYRRGVVSLGELGAFLEKRGVSVLWLTAALFHRMVDEELARLRGVRQVLAGGEALSVSHVRRYLEGLPAGHRLVNGYGPTENTTFTCCHVMDRETLLEQTVPIGRPVSNTRVYVLDGERALVPVGVVGELYAGGDGLARGYLNQPELTAEKFVESPFAEGERLYCTGDLVRWREGGVLEYVGRADRQVKLRGYRIELGEVEHALAAHAGVREAVVLCREDTPGEKRLVAYVVAERAGGVAPEGLRAQLKERLPEYMLPSAVVLLDELPLTPNGKVDRAALPAPDGERQLGDAYVAPRNELEARIAAIWCEVLGVGQLGVQDNFFDLGGHSLLAMQVVSRIRADLGVDLTLTGLFTRPTVEGLTEQIDISALATTGADDEESGEREEFTL
jgi:amino acid adenylation domain-containing protein